MIRCPKIPNVSDGYYMCHPSDDMIYGAVCRFGCYAGHELTGGVSEITCTKEGKWSNSFPRCQSNTYFIYADNNEHKNCNLKFVKLNSFCRSNMSTSLTFNDPLKIPMFR